MTVHALYKSLNMYYLTSTFSIQFYIIYILIYLQLEKNVEHLFQQIMYLTNS